MFKKITTTPTTPTTTPTTTQHAQTSDNNEASPFFTDIFDNIDNIAVDDKIKIIGKDPFKGHIGIVIRISTNLHHEQAYTIQLQTTGETIDRSKKYVKRYY